MPTFQCSALQKTSYRVQGLINSRTLQRLRQLNIASFFIYTLWKEVALHRMYRLGASLRISTDHLLQKAAESESFTQAHSPCRKEKGKNYSPDAFH